MSFSLPFAFHAGHLVLLRFASLLVPRPLRHEWRREWDSELWHVRRSLDGLGAFSLQAQFEITAFCAGSLADSLAVRRQPRPAGSVISVHGSAAQCVLRLSSFLIFCAVLARFLPGLRAEFDSARLQMRPGLISVGDWDSAGFQPSISFAQYRAWKSSPQRYFDGLAFYRTSPEPASAGPGTLRVAYATRNLFSVLGLPVQMARTVPDDDRFPALILSREAWLHDFANDPLLPGSLVSIGHHTVRVAGMVSVGSWRLPGQPDAWLLESNAATAAAAPSGVRGFVLAQLSPLGRAEMSGNHISISDNSNDLDDLCGTSLVEPVDGPGSVFAFALLLALLALPAVTSMALSESSFSSHRPSWKTRLHRWAFVAAKFVLGAAIAFFASCDLAYWNSVGYSSMAEFAQFAFAFVLCLFTFRWAILDQRHRCPVCLRRVPHPAQVGLA